MKTPVQVLPTSYGFDTANTRGTAVTCPFSAGAFTTTAVQLTASTDFDACGLWLWALPNGNDSFQARLYVGGSGSEVLFVETAMGSSTNECTGIFIPIAVPAGSRISARVADTGSSGNTVYLHVTLVRGRTWDPLVSYGRVYGASSGQFPNVDGGGTANTKGAYTQITSSTTNDAKGFSLVILGDASSDTSTRFSFDVAIGAAASEIIILADACSSQPGFTADTHPSILGPFWTPIPAASRIAARVAASNNSANSRVPRIGVILWE